jgi:hypothetical protein
MASPARDWNVLPHGRLTYIDDNILTVTGTISMPVGALPRRMTVVRLRDRRLVIFSAMALEETEMWEIEGFGHPAFLVVPNDHHRLDAPAWKHRYRHLKVIAPEGSRAKVEKAVHVDATTADFNDTDVRLFCIPGTDERELAMEVRGPSGITLVLNDLIGNIRHTSGVSGWFLRLVRFSGDEPRIPVPVKRVVVDNKALVREQLEKWAALPSLRSILVSHGSVIDENPRGTLLRLAESLT